MIAQLYYAGYRISMYGVRIPVGPINFFNVLRFQGQSIR